MARRLLLLSAAILVEKGNSECQLCRIIVIMHHDYATVLQATEFITFT